MRHLVTNSCIDLNYFFLLHIREPTDFTISTENESKSQKNEDMLTKEQSDTFLKSLKIALTNLQPKWTNFHLSMYLLRHWMELHKKNHEIDTKNCKRDIQSLKEIQNKLIASDKDKQTKICNSDGIVPYLKPKPYANSKKISNEVEKYNLQARWNLSQHRADQIKSLLGV